MQQALPPPSWDTWRELMRKSRRSNAGKQAGLWALGVLETELGATWPKDLYEATGSVPSEVFGFGYATEFARLLELSLRLTILRERPGYSAVRRDLRRDLRHERRSHSAIQLEVAALAQRLGRGPSMEVTTADRGPADVTFGSPAGRIAAEIRVVLRDATSRAAELAWDQLMARLLALEAEHRVVFGGGLDLDLPDHEVDQLVVALGQIAAQVALDRQIRTLEHPAGNIEVIPDEKASDVTFKGPRHASNGWPRIASILREKASQASRTGARWLRIDVLDGLWQLTEWSRGGLAEKTERLAAAVAEELASSELHGVALTSGAGLVLGPVEEMTFQNDRITGLRRLVPPVRARETIIVPLRESAQPQGRAWSELYESEPDWLPWALAECGLPSLEEVTAWDRDD